MSTTLEQATSSRDPGSWVRRIAATDLQDGAFRKALVMIAAAALTLRVFAAFFSGLPWISTDTIYYFEMADAIIQGSPMAAYPNGLPLLIALAKLTFKAEWVAPGLIVLNILLSTLTVWFAIRMSLDCTNNKFAALVTGLVLAVYPNQLNYVRQLMTEVPATFLLTLTIFLVLRKRTGWAGLTATMAGLVRPSLFPVFPAILILMLVLKRDADIWQGLLGFILSLGVYEAMVMVGLVRPSIMAGHDLLVAIGSYSHNTNFGPVFAADQIAHPYRTYFLFALQQPIIFILQRLDSLWELWGPLPSGVARSILPRIILSLRFPLLIAAVFGFWKARNFEAWLLLIPVLVITIVHVAYFSSPRFTVTVEPLVVILAVSILFRNSQRASNALA